MIKINISNLDEQNFQIEIPDQASLSDVKDILFQNFRIDTQNSKIFLQSRCLKDNFIFNSQDFETVPTLILYDHNLYPEKQYPIGSLPSIRLPYKYKNMYIKPKKFNKITSLHASRLTPQFPRFTSDMVGLFPPRLQTINHSTNEDPLSLIPIQRPRESTEQELLIEQNSQLTEADTEAINRLQASGAPRYLVVQVYIACERNENDARNLLMNFH